MQMKYWLAAKAVLANETAKQADIDTEHAKVEALIDKKDYAGALDVVRTMPHTDSVTSNANPSMQ